MSDRQRRAGPTPSLEEIYRAFATYHSMPPRHRDKAHLKHKLTAMLLTVEPMAWVSASFQRGKDATVLKAFLVFALKANRSAATKIAG
jgi:hypothetical protein